MSTGFLKFIGALLLVGSIGFATVKGTFTAGFRFATPGFAGQTDVPAAHTR